MDEKSNEITAVPELLDSLNIEHSIVTTDVMGCQKEIVKKIREGKVDYVIGLRKAISPPCWGIFRCIFRSFPTNCPVLSQKKRTMGELKSWNTVC